MNDRPEHPDESWQPLEDHEQPTRRIDRIEPDPAEVPADDEAPAESADFGETLYNEPPYPVEAGEPDAEDEEADSSLAETRLGSIPDLPFDPMAPHDTRSA